MRTQSRFLAPVLGGALIAMLGATYASAQQYTRTFLYLAAATEDSLGTPFCEVVEADCPDAAIASSTGDRIEISEGVGFLTIHPKSISGGGEFSATALERGGDPVSGRWEAAELLSFKSYGPSDLFPPSEGVEFNAGLAHIRIHLLVDNSWVADAILELSCRLPGAEWPPSTEEGVRVNVQDGLNFNVAVQPNATLFVELLP